MLHSQENSPSVKKDIPTLSFTKINGTLIVTNGEKSCLLVKEAIAYETYVSPDTQMIAVEVQLLSNLQIIRMYKKNSAGCYKPFKNPLSTKLWGTLSEKKGFSIDDVLHPRMQFLKWVDNNQILIKISGDLGDKSIDKKLSYALEE